MLKKEHKRMSADFSLSHIGGYGGGGVTGVRWYEIQRRSFRLGIWDNFKNW